MGSVISPVIKVCGNPETLIVGILKPGIVPARAGLYLLDIIPDGEVRFGFPNINDTAEIMELIACGAHTLITGEITDDEGYPGKEPDINQLDPQDQSALSFLSRAGSDDMTDGSYGPPCAGDADCGGAAGSCLPGG